MTAPRYIVEPLPEIIADSSGGSLPIGWIGPVGGVNTIYETLPCDGRAYDPERYPQLHAVLWQTRRVRRWRWWPFAHRTVSGGVYGDNRVPDLRGRIIIP